tara:strand:- start:81 stop:578 length:498 start_codon:yes stop_codon:yes gene_type:complete
MALTKINNNTLSAVTTLPSAIATGKVLQVVTDVHSTEITTNNPSNGTAVDSGLSAAITPSSTSNKILILLSMQLYLQRSSASTLYAHTVIKANNSAIFNGQDAEIVSGGSTAEYGLRTSVQFLHSPNSTSQQTYTVNLTNDSSPNEMVINRNSSPAVLTLMEVAG